MNFNFLSSFLIGDNLRWASPPDTVVIVRWRWKKEEDCCCCSSATVKGKHCQCSTMARQLSGISFQLTSLYLFVPSLGEWHKCVQMVSARQLCRESALVQTLLKCTKVRSQVRWAAIGSTHTHTLVLVLVWNKWVCALCVSLLISSKVCALLFKCFDLFLPLCVCRHELWMHQLTS